MNLPKSLAVTAIAAAALTLAACGSSGAQSSGVVTAAGLNLTAGNTTVSLPAGALPDGTQVTLREDSAHRSGGHKRIELEPRGRALASPGTVYTTVSDDRSVDSIDMRGDDDSHNGSFEVEDRNHHRYKGQIHELREIEVEVRHGVCATACAANQECEHGQCVAHEHDETAAACATPCASGLECEHGQCVPHGGGR